MRLLNYTVSICVSPADENKFLVTVKHKTDTVADFEDHMVGCMSRIGQVIMSDVEETL